MKSKVYYSRVSESDSVAVVQQKFSRLLDRSAVLDSITGKTAAVKMHFGEEGNTGFVKPHFVRQVAERVSVKGVRPVVTDTNTLYKGRRTDSAEHLRLAHEHGFTREAVDADVMIASSGQNAVAGVAINGRYIKEAFVETFFTEVSSIVGIAHFKGHIMTGFGGALKNIGMGCASRKGKLAQHCDVSPVVWEKTCIGCGTCVGVCPVQAITVIDTKARIDKKSCIGCATCIAVCPVKAIDVPWETGASRIQEKMVEYAWAVLKDKKNTSAFINFATKITKECDCLAQDESPMTADVGIFVSSDPVSLDMATYETVIAAAGNDVFREAHPQRDGLKQIRHAEKIGLGSSAYELQRIDG
ncbi:MAG TPA: DUF362 domain-containing protein [Candidatus Omnitrophota bacterium]|nr:DUF362 domain-containing protein [Candidatus Omnitrophota bacterium]HPT07820.1 DUF362 domain-containing protein [Candidatus Omnitrophota bacterium]